MTQYPDLFAALAAPFESQEVKSRQAPGGRPFLYVTARTVMNRLDNVLGPENWWDSYTPQENSVLCCLTVRLPDGQILSKSDAGGYAGMADQGDDEKSAFSDAFKRAAIKFGVGRYLYRDGVPLFAREAAPVPVQQPQAEPAPAPARTRDRDRDRDREREQAAQPQAEAAAASAAPEPAPVPAPQSSAPRTGKALFAWTREQEQRYEFGLLKYLNGWAKLQEYPARMVDWDPEQVSLGYAEACRKLHSHVGSRQQEAASSAA
ncbi:MAG: Rad52/Rad22 family DNA repair protein [Isosphaeraceae bacterium]